MNDAVAKRRMIILDGIKAYAEWDKSDPYTYGRCVAHYRRGLCRPNDKGENSHYEAQKIVDGNGNNVYINIKRV